MPTQRPVHECSYSLIWKAKNNPKIETTPKPINRWVDKQTALLSNNVEWITDTGNNKDESRMVMLNEGQTKKSAHCMVPSM